MSGSNQVLGSLRMISGLATLFLCLSLTGCYFHSQQPLLFANDDFPFRADPLQFEERSLDKGAWANPSTHRLRRTGPSTFVGIDEHERGFLSFNNGLNREIRFERLRPGFFAVMWKNDGDISEAPHGYFYDLVYVDRARQHVYRWHLNQILTIGDQPYLHLYQFCSERYHGPPITRPGITITFNDRTTLFTVLNGCINEIVSRRIPPSSRFRWM